MDLKSSPVKRKKGGLQKLEKFYEIEPMGGFFFTFLSRAFADPNLNLHLKNLGLSQLDQMLHDICTVCLAFLQLYLAQKPDILRTLHLLCPR